MSNVVQLRPNLYRAHTERFEASGYEIQMSGTLDGFIDLAITYSNGGHSIFSLTCDDARRIIAGLHAVVDDIQANCMFDRDPRLVS